MKKITSVDLLIVLIVALATIPLACTTSQQRIAANTIGAEEATADAAVAGYYDSVIKGITPTNQVPMVSKAYNDFHLAALVEIDAAQAGTNALASTNLTQELSDLLQLAVAVIPTNSTPAKPKSTAVDTNSLEKITPKP